MPGDAIPTTQMSVADDLTEINKSILFYLDTDGMSWIERRSEPSAIEVAFRLCWTLLAPMPRTQLARGPSQFAGFLACPFCWI